MKKTLIVGIVILLVMFFVTCDEFFPVDGKVEYTDVEYSEDGSRVTLYLDGVGVPLTAAQRAMSTRLSKMAYDYLDVVFISNGNPRTVARAQWELGQSAGISGVARGTAASPIDYKWEATTLAGVYGSAGSVALLAAGRKEGKTLLGIGRIAEVDNSASLPTTATGGPNGDVAWTTGWVTTPTDPNLGLPNTPYAIIRPNTKSVTFYITAVKTGLIVNGETTVAAGNDLGITVDSFPGDTVINGVVGDYEPGTIKSTSSRTELGNSKVPTYPLPLSGAATAKYTFFGAPLTYINQIIYTNPTATKKIYVEPRFPRYQYNGGYRQLSAAIDMRSTVEPTTPAPTGFSNVVPLTFDVKGTGIFSFYIEIPVYILTGEEGTNTGKLPGVAWKIRTGLGSELYSLDDGAAGGGCVLMSIGKLDLEDWLEIQWIWLP